MNHWDGEERLMRQAGESRPPKLKSSEGTRICVAETCCSFIQQVTEKARTLLQFRIARDHTRCSGVHPVNS